MSSEGIDPEILRDFAAETRENLARMEEHLLLWERSKIAKEQFDDMFRAVHNLKGTCGFLGFRNLEELSHQMESALGLFRNQATAEKSGRMAGLLLRALDVIESVLQQIESVGTDHCEIASLVSGLSQISEEESGSEAQLEPPVVTVLAAGGEINPERPVLAPKPAAAPVEEEEEVDPAWLLTDEELIRLAAQEDEEKRIAELAKEVPLEKVVEPVPIAIGHVPPILAPAATFDKEEEEAAIHRAAEPLDEEARSSGADSTVRVPRANLDRVLELVSELALTRNLIMHMSRQNGSRSDVQHALQLHRLTDELETQVLKLRLQPLKAAFAPLTRLVRETALACGKHVRLEIEGQETETDRVIIDAVRDPLQHLVRNSIDHGIESPAERVAKGKPEEGLVRITARYAGGRVAIEIEDDGAGLNLTRIRDKVVTQRLATAEQVKTMSPTQLQQFIFRPGFSTAAQVSLISGRGVGLDIVKRNLEKISASVEVNSTPGKGTRFKIITNRALITVSALVVEVSGMRFAIAHMDLIKVVWLGPNDESDLVRVEGGQFYRDGEYLLPLLELRQSLSLPKGMENKENGLLFAVVGSGDQRFGMVVDEVHDSEEIIVRPLGKYLSQMEHYKGVAILEEGGLVLLLNLAPMLRLIDFEAVSDGQLKRREAARAGLEKNQDPEVDVVLCRVLQRGLLAIRLSEVIRLEELDPEKLEAEGQAESAQYWGEILRLVPVQRLLVPNMADPELWRSRTKIPIIVVEREAALFGFVVTEIIDVVRARLKLVREDTRPGLFGTILVQGKIAELIDGQGLIDLFEQSNQKKPVESEAK